MNFIKMLIPESVKRYTRIIRSILAAARYVFPSRKLKLIGVTGTSGKSTTTAMIYHVLSENDINVGTISTVGAQVGNKSIETGFHVTTPDPGELQRLLKFMVKRGAEYVVLETSSHALAQGRLGLLKFDYAVFTNIKRDHLDWHGSWEAYATAKAILAKKVKKSGQIVVNREDKEMYHFLSQQLDALFDDKAVTYSFNEILNVSESEDAIQFRLNDTNFSLPVLGLYNVENALAAINIAMLLKIPTQQIANALKSFPGLEGRMQIMQREPFFIIVDFAHNTDSLKRSLQAAKKRTAYNGKVISVFGSAGLRDVEKRYTMGEIAVTEGDIVIVTAEDPRIESLFDINSQIIEGAEKAGGTLVTRFANSKELQDFGFEPRSLNHGSIFAFDEESVQGRYDAVSFALRIAQAGDVVILEGKGHEKSLCFGATEFSFTDQEAVLKALPKKA